MDILSFLTWQFVLFSLSVATVMYVIRIFVQYFWENSKKSKAWNELLLPTLPVFLGSTMAFFFKFYPFPEGLVSRGDHVIFGMVAGLVSGLLYRVLNKMFGNKIKSMFGQFSDNTTESNDDHDCCNDDKNIQSVRDSIVKKD